jgi:hypothetical protein
VGYNTVLFFTTSNVGLDVDSKPPTAEISISRAEGVIGPTFESGKTLPVVASFRTNVKGLLGLAAEVSSTFAGGNAATTMTALFGDPDTSTLTPFNERFNAGLCLSKAPDPIDVFGLETLRIEPSKPGEVRPFVFGTATSFGLKVSWSGTSAQYPDSVKLGYNRKDFAWAPVFSSPGTPPICPDPKVTVSIPSFLATVDSLTAARAPSESGLEYFQYFATGDAATNLALRPEIRRVMLSRIDPPAEAAVRAQKNIDDLNTRAQALQKKAAH